MGGVGGSFIIEIIYIELVFNYVYHLLTALDCFPHFINVSDWVFEVKAY